jgi:hypothetical protein
MRDNEKEKYKTIDKLKNVQRTIITRTSPDTRLINPSSKKWDNLLIKNNYFYNQYVRAIVLVREFIQSHKLIIYGGTAVDFALRSQGTALYDDVTASFPDLDFFSPDSARHAYELGEILHNAGVSDVSVIPAYHVQTMRVRTNMISVADLSYVPPNIFKTLPTIEYDGYLVIHPHYQMMSMHIGMSFPFINAPREVFMDRKNKDFERYDMLYEHFPIIAPKVELKRQKYTIDVDNMAVWTGLLTYVALYEKMQGLIRGEADANALPFAQIIGAPDPNKIIVELDWTANSDVGPSFTMIRSGEHPIAAPEGMELWTSYMDMIPHSLLHRYDGHVQQYLYYNARRIHVSRIGDHLITSTLYAQAVLQFLYYVTGQPIYLIYYLALWKMNKVMYELLMKTAATADNKDVPDTSPFLIPMQLWPSMETPDISDSLQISLDATMAAVMKRPREKDLRPMPYYPGNAGAIMPKFDYDASSYFEIGYVRV